LAVAVPILGRLGIIRVGGQPFPASAKDCAACLQARLELGVDSLDMLDVAAIRLF